MNFKFTGLENVPSRCPRQVHFPSGQATSHSHLHDGLEIEQVICQLNHLRCKLRKGQAKFEGYFSHVQNAIQLFIRTLI